MNLNTPIQNIVEVVSPMYTTINYHIQYPSNTLVNKSSSISNTHKLLVHQKVGLSIMYPNIPPFKIGGLVSVISLKNRVLLYNSRTRTNLSYFTILQVQKLLPLVTFNKPIIKISYSKLNYTSFGELSRMGLIELRADVLRWRIGLVTTLYSSLTVIPTSAVKMVKKCSKRIQLLECGVLGLNFTRKASYGIKVSLEYFKICKDSIIYRLRNKRFNITGVGYIDFDYVTGLMLVKHAPLNGQTTIPKGMQLSTHLWSK